MSRHSAQLESIEREIDATRDRIDNTLDALTEKVSASRLVGQALDSVRENGGMFAGNLVHTARDNPMATTLLATGLAWLMISDRRGRTGSADSQAQPGNYPPGGYTRPSPDHVAPDRTTPAAPRQPVAGMAGPTATDRVKAAAGTAAASARAATHDLRDRVGDAGEEAGRRATDAYAGARDATRRAGSFLAENPLMVGALGLAVGAVAAAALPATRREDEWLGEAGDKLRDDAASAARQVVREGAKVAEAAIDSGKEEAKRRKLTPGDARQAAEDGAAEVVRGAAEVAKSAVHTAEEETRRRTGNGAPQSH